MREKHGVAGTGSHIGNHSLWVLIAFTLPFSEDCAIDFFIDKKWMGSTTLADQSWFFLLG